MKSLSKKLGSCLLCGLLAIPTSSALCAPGVEHVVEKTEKLDVLLLSDHTLPGHLDRGSSGANGIERSFIDPSIAVARSYLEAEGLTVHVLNVEDMLPGGNVIETEEDFELAYANYDRVLKAAVENSVTIIALHFDADIIMAGDYKDGTTYIGGVQIILDGRNVSPETFKLAYIMLHDYRILASLNDAGFRTRPGYQNEIRYQDNLTLNIAGASAGGAFLLELAALDQAIRLYRDVGGTVDALKPSLQLLARGIEGFRRQMGLKHTDG